VVGIVTGDNRERSRVNGIIQPIALGDRKSKGSAGKPAAGPTPVSGDGSLWSRTRLTGRNRQLSKTGNSKGKGRVNQNPKYAYPSNALRTEPNDVGGSVRDCGDSPPRSIEIGCQSDWSSDKESCKTGGQNCLHGRVGLRVRIEVRQD